MLGAVDKSRRRGLLATRLDTGEMFTLAVSQLELARRVK
jgi:hypothetical protein